MLTEQPIRSDYVNFCVCVRTKSLVFFFFAFAILFLTFHDNGLAADAYGTAASACCCSSSAAHIDLSLISVVKFDTEKLNKTIT